MVLRVESERVNFGNVELLRYEDRWPIVKRTAVCPPEVNLERATILPPGESLEAVNNSDLLFPAQELLCGLINKGRVLDWMDKGIGVGLDYSRILNRVVDVGLCRSMSLIDARLMMVWNANWILAPDTSGTALAMSDAVRSSQLRDEIVLVRLQKSQTLTMSRPLEVMVESYTRMDGTEPLVHPLVVEVGDFPLNTSIRAVVKDDIFDTGAVVVAICELARQLREYGVDIQIVAALSAFSKTYAGNCEVFTRLGIDHVHSWVEIEGLVPMTEDNRGLIKVLGIDDWLTLERTDVNGEF